ncbi:MAG: FABP family protein [Acidimicrobiales bacterium]
MNEPNSTPALGALGALIGEWSGRGHGSYPTTEDFDYEETISFASTGKAFLVYNQKTVDARDGRPLHAEAGYLRSLGDGRVEMVIAQPTGVVEVDEGVVVHNGEIVEVKVASSSVAFSSTAKAVDAVKRTLRLEDGILSTTLAMAAVGVPLTHHLASQLRQSGQTAGNP